MDDVATPWDSIVIGGSAAGLSSALMLGRAGRRVLVIDSGMPRNRFADHMHGVLGHEGKPPSELVALGRRELSTYSVDFLDDGVLRVENSDDHVSVHTHGGSELRARTLVVATGVTDELPDVPGLAGRWGVDVLHCPYCHGYEVRNRRMGVLATSSASLHQAQMVRQWTNDVVFFSAAAGTLAPTDARRLAARGIEVVDAPMTEIVVENDAITGARTSDGRTTPVDVIFTAATTHPNDTFLNDLHLERSAASGTAPTFLTVDAAGKTSHPRIWAVGNVVTPGANVPMVMGAASFTGTAVNGWLVEDDFDRALTNSSPWPRDTSGHDR